MPLIRTGMKLTDVAKCGSCFKTIAGLASYGELVPEGKRIFTAKCSHCDQETQITIKTSEYGSSAEAYSE